MGKGFKRLYMINTCNKVSKLAMDYYRQLNKSFFPEEKANVVYGMRDSAYAAILDIVTPKPMDIVLDIGCGESAFVLMLAKYAKKVYGIDDASFANYSDWFNDISKKQEIQSGRVEILEQSAKTIPLPDESIDVVYTISALEHFDGDGDILAVSEVNRILKKGGYFVGTVDYNPATEKPLGNDDPCKVYTYESFMDRVVQYSGCRLVGDVDLPSAEDFKTILAGLFFCLYKGE